MDWSFARSIEPLIASILSFDKCPDVDPFDERP
jgi:hypothetical protein